MPSNCKHKWDLADPEYGWRLARCLSCKSVDAFEVGPVGETKFCSRCVTTRLTVNQVGEIYCLVCGNRPSGPTMTKREFLRSKNVNKPLTEEEMAPVVSYARIHGITAASRYFNHPLSTVGKWAHGESPKKWQHRHYSHMDKVKALEVYRMTGNNFKETAQQTGIPRSTLQGWSDRGEWYKAL